MKLRFLFERLQGQVYINRKYALKILIQQPTSNMDMLLAHSMTTSLSRVYNQQILSRHFLQQNKAMGFSIHFPRADRGWPSWLAVCLHGGRGRSPQWWPLRAEIRSAPRRSPPAPWHDVPPSPLPGSGSGRDRQTPPRPSTGVLRELLKQGRCAGSQGVI